MPCRSFAGLRVADGGSLVNGLRTG